MISWLQSASAASVGRSTSTASEEYSSYAVTTITETYETTTGTPTSSETSTYVSTLDEVVPWYTRSDSASSSANYSGTTNVIVYTSWGYVDPAETNYDTSTFEFVRSNVTHISNVNATTTSGNNGPAIGGQGGLLSVSETVSVESTRSAQTSTTQAMIRQASTSTTTNYTKKVWTTSSGESLAFYSTQATETTATTSTFEQIVIEDATTTNATEIYYGHDATIYQCRTRDADAEIAWTAAQSYALSSYSISALSSFASTATRWTQLFGNDTVRVTQAATISGSPVPTVSFPAISALLNYTTSSVIAGTLSRYADIYRLPIDTETVAYQKATTITASTESVFIPATTFSTIQNINEVFPTETVVSWGQTFSSWTTGNGSMTWHATAAIPATFEVTRLSSVKTALAGYTVDDAELNTTRQGCSLHLPTNEVAQRNAWISGMSISQGVGLFANLNMGKTFTVNGEFTAHHSRSTLLSTVFPGSYELSGDAFSGTLVISGESASATFVPTNTDQSATTTSALFSTEGQPATIGFGQRSRVLGGKPASQETFFESWPLGIYKNEIGNTVSKTPTVVSRADSTAVSWWQPIAGIAPATTAATGNVIAYTVARNRTALPS